MTKKRIIDFLKERGHKAKSTGIYFVYNEINEVVEAIVYMAGNQRVSITIRDDEVKDVKSF